MSRSLAAACAGLALVACGSSPRQPLPGHAAAPATSVHGTVAAASDHLAAARL